MSVSRPICDQWTTVTVVPLRPIPYRWTPESASGITETPYTWPPPSATDPVVLRVEATTKACDCDWYLALLWTRGGISDNQRIDADGKPFRTSSGANRPEYDHPDGTGGWTK